jgi:hypothetical protein
MQNGKYFVEGDHTEDTLMPAFEKARSAFLQFINSRFPIEADTDGWYRYKRRMAKNDQ